MGVGKAFYDHSGNYLKVYKNYTTQIKIVQDRLRILKQRNQPFRNYLETLESEGKRLEVILQMPVQRLCAMNLLFQNVLSHFPVGSAEYNECSPAAKQMAIVSNLEKTCRLLHWYELLTESYSA